MYIIVDSKDSEKLVKLMCKLVGAEFQTPTSSQEDTWSVTLLGETRYLTDIELVNNFKNQPEIFIIFPRNTESTKLHIFCEDLDVEINIHDGLKMENIMDALKFKKLINRHLGYKEAK